MLMKIKSTSTFFQFNQNVIPTSNKQEVLDLITQKMGQSQIVNTSSHSNFLMRLKNLSEMQDYQSIKYTHTMSLKTNGLAILLGLLVSLSVVTTQKVDCLKQVQSSYGYPTSCQSTSSQTRPINATAFVKSNKNTTWYGAADWNPYIVRGLQLVHDLYIQPSCFQIEPNSGKWIAGRTYEFGTKCTLLTFELQKGDAVYFDLFEDPAHKAAECAFAIPIPGYSTVADFSPQQIADFRKQALSFKKRRGTEGKLGNLQQESEDAEKTSSPIKETSNEQAEE